MLDLCVVCVVVVLCEFLFKVILVLIMPFLLLFFSLFFSALDIFSQSFFIATHSASIPSRPRTCHQRSPPTTRLNSASASGLLRSDPEGEEVRRKSLIRISAASLHETRGIRMEITVVQKGEGTWVLVLQ